MISPKLKSFLKHIIYYFIGGFVNLFIFSKKEITPNSILLIRLDAIGDYALFRNFIELLTKNKKYKEHKITLLGNSAWKDLALELDSDFIDKFIWLDRNRFNKNLLYRYEKLQEIASSGYEIVINPTYSRDFFVSDNIVKVVNANEKIGSRGDLSNMKIWQKAISDKYYTKLLDAKDEIMFEFYRNREFFENLLQAKSNIKKPFINLKERKLNFILPKKYMVIFIGSSAKYRKWSVKNFAEIAMFIKENYGYEIVLCGGLGDVGDVFEFNDSCSKPYVDLVGKTSLVELLHVLKSAALLLSNETSAVHLTAALGGINIFVVSNANHYKRFTPYPKAMLKNYHAIFPAILDFSNEEELASLYGFGSTLDINEISVDSVENKIKEALDA